MTHLLAVSNGHGEDAIAGQILDALMPQLPDKISLSAWPMVGDGAAFHARGIAIHGPAQHLPSEGFGTLDRSLFLRDLRAGFVPNYLRQLRHARGLRGQHTLLLGVGDVVPLMAAYRAQTPMAFVACAKSSWYGGATAAKGGHNALERTLMRRVCPDIFPRDSLTAQGLAAQGLPVHDFGNPMMDGLVATGPALVQPGETGVAVLPGSRADATDNVRFLLQAIQGFDALSPPSAVVFLFAITSATNLDSLRADLTGWRIDPGEGLHLTAPNGTRAKVLRGQFAQVLANSVLAIGLAGTANEQAIGLGLPLITTHGSGSQGPAFLAMKLRYFGGSALGVARDPAAVAASVTALLADPSRRAAMAAEGRKRMGPPGASAKIAAQILHRLEQLPCP